MGQAISEARGALQNETCRKLFGDNVDPVKLLNNLVAEGKIKWDFSSSSRTNDPALNAVTVMNGPSAGNILINPNPNTQFNSGDPSWGNWSRSVAQNRAMTLIHELAHAARALYGNSASKIVDDGNSIPTSMANHRLVYEFCFAKFRFSAF